MTDNLATLFSRICDRFGAAVDHLVQKVGDLKNQGVRLATAVAPNQASIAQMPVTLAGRFVRMDRMDERLSRMERRLQLAEA